MQIVRIKPCANPELDLVYADRESSGMLVEVGGMTNNPVTAAAVY